MFFSTQFQDDKRTKTVFLCSLSPNAHRNCRLLRKIPRSNSALQVAKLSLQAGGENVQLSMDPEDCKQLFSKVHWKKVFDANGKITRFWSFERSGGKASFCTFDNFQKPGITETGNRKRGLSGFRTARGGKAHILKVKMPLIQLFIKPSSADAPSVVYQANCPAISFVCWTINYLMPLQLFIKPSADKIIHLHGLHRNRSPQSDLCISLLLAKKTILTDAM